ncbi:MAG: DUF4123 domain-containing protein [Terrimicrobiaceae bacterium]
MPESLLPAAAPQAVTSAPLEQDLTNILRTIGGPLFALLDATRDPLRILGMLRSSGEKYQSLYEGLQGRMLEAYAPYLVRLPGDSRLLETLVAQGWGKNWGIFVVSAADFQSLRKHFRTFLMVKSPEGEQLYFRYYDPRVLREYLPTCNAEETNFVFGPVAAYLCEGEASDALLVFQPGQDFVQCEAVELSGAVGETSSEPADPASPGTAFLKSMLSE